MSDVLVPWDEVASEYRRAFPNEDLETLRRRYEGRRDVEIARHMLGAEGESVGRYIARRSLPGFSAVLGASEASEYAAARERLNRGDHTDRDVGLVADYEHERDRDASRGLSGQIASSLAHIPAMVGEAYLGGSALRGLGMVGQAPSVARAIVSPSAWGRNLAQTAVMPSMWLQPAAERAAQQGGSWYSPENLGPAALMGFAQTAVLGSVGKFANGIAGDGVKPFLTRLAARTFAGMGEQQALDVAGGLADKFLPEALQTRTRFGTIGAFLDGKKGDGWKHLATQLVTFGAFSALHPILHGEQKPEAPQGSPAEPSPQPRMPDTQMVEPASPIQEASTPDPTMRPRQQSNQYGWEKPFPEHMRPRGQDMGYPPSIAEIAAHAEKQVADLVRKGLTEKKAVEKVADEYAQTNLMLQEAQAPRPSRSQATEEPQVNTPVHLNEQPIAQPPTNAPEALPGEQPVSSGQTVPDAQKGQSGAITGVPEASVEPAPAVESRSVRDLFLDHLDNKVSREEVNQAAELTKVQANDFWKRFDAMREGRTLTQEQIGMERGLSKKSAREAVRQNEAKAIAKLKLPGKSVEEMRAALAAEEQSSRAERTTEIPGEEPGSAKYREQQRQAAAELRGTGEEEARATGQAAPKDAVDLLGAVHDKIADKYLSMDPKDITFEHMRQFEKEATEAQLGKHLADADKMLTVAEKADKRGSSVVQALKRAFPELRQHTNQELLELVKGLRDARSTKAGSQPDVPSTEGVPSQNPLGEAAGAAGGKAGEQQNQAGLPPEGAGPGGIAAPAGGPSATGRLIKGRGRRGSIDLGVFGAFGFGRKDKKPETPPATPAGPRNASVEAQREASNLPPVEKRAPVSKEEFWGKARSIIADHPAAGMDKVNDYAQRPRGFESGMDQALIAHEQLSTHSQYDKVQAKQIEAIAKGDEIAKAGATAELAVLRERLDLIDKVNEYGGTTWHEVGEARQIMANQDFSLTRMMMEREGYKGKPLTDAEKSQVGAINKKIRDLQDKIDRGDFSKDPKKPQRPLSNEEVALKAELQRLKDEFREGNLRLEAQNRPAWQKVAGFVSKWRRGFLLSSPVTLAKLSSAAVQRVVFQPLESLAGVGIGKLIPGVYDKATFEGRSSIAIESKALAEGFMRIGQDIKSVMKTGEMDISHLYGKKHFDIDPSLADYVGRIHAALKTVPKRAAYTRAMEQGFEAAAKGGLDITDPLVQTRIGVEALKQAESAIFQQDNWVVNMWKRAMAPVKDPLTGKESTGSVIRRTVGEIALPIVKVPTNIVIETFQHAFGLATGGARLANAYAKGIENLHPQQADVIMRELKKGAVGAGVMALGYFLRDSIGGYHQPGEKRDKDDVSFGAIKIGGFEIPPYLLHNPLIMALQLGATVGRIADSKVKGDKQGLAIGSAKALLGLAEDVPFVREMGDIRKLMSSSPGGALGEQAKSLIVPQAAQWGARQIDRKDGEQVKRKQTGFMEHIQSGVPVWRQSLDAINPDVEQFKIKLGHLHQERLGHMQNPETSLTHFPQQRQLITLEHFGQHINRIEHMIRGDVRFGHTPYRAGQAPDESRVRELRGLQADLARRALEAVRR